MIRRKSTISLVAFTILLTAVGCHPQQPSYLFEDGDLSHWVNESTRIEYPDAEIDPIPDVVLAQRPLTLDNPDPEDMWELPLEEAVQISLRNSRVMKNLGGVAFSVNGVQGAPSALLSNPNAAITMYDPALIESDPRYGVEAALAAFDGQFSTNIFWQKFDTPQNVQPGGVFTNFRRTVNQADVGTFDMTISKQSATGGTFAMGHSWEYNWDNLPSGNLTDLKRWPSAWTVNLEGSFTQPILQGAGTQFNRIAGPGAVPGFYNGVMIARIREDVALADFEMAVRDVVFKTEEAYWNLHYMYRRLDSVRAGRDSALQTYRQVQAKADQSSLGGSAKDVAQAEQQYLIFLSELQRTSSELYKTERALRYIMGISATDGRLIRPADEPADELAVHYDWASVLGEAICRSPELRRQRWEIERRELELKASKNFLLPSIDAVGKYRLVGLGQDLIDPEDSVENAYGSLAGGDFAEWELGVNLSFPFGFRKEYAGVRNAQLQLQKANAVLHEQELELSHQLADSFDAIDKYYRLSRTNFNRRNAGVAEVQATLQAYEAGLTTLDQLLDAQRRLAEGETEYYRSLIDYNVAIAQLEYRKGSLLERNNIHLTEGPWPKKAYFDATRLARQRDASIYTNYTFTRPNVISRGKYNQHSGETNAAMPNIAIPEGVEIVTPPTGRPLDSAPANNTPAQPFEMPADPTDGGQAMPGSAPQSMHSQPIQLPLNSAWNRMPMRGAPMHNRPAPQANVQAHQPVAQASNDFSGGLARLIADSSTSSAPTHSTASAPPQTSQGWMPTAEEGAVFLPSPVRQVSHEEPALTR